MPDHDALLAASEAQGQEARKVASIRLSRRMVDVLIEIADGATNLEVAERLGISLDTVKVHLVRLYRALGATGRQDAVQVGYRAGFLHACPTCCRPRVAPQTVANDQRQEQP